MSLRQEYLTSNTNTAHPFAEDARSLDRGSGGFPMNVVADALFSVPASYPVSGKRLYLVRHENNDVARTVTFFVGDGATEVLTFTAQLPAVGVAPEQWIMAADDNTVAGFPPLYFSGTLVLDGPAAVAFLDTAPGANIYGPGLPFEITTQVVNNPAVTSLDVYNAGPAGSGEAVDGDVDLLSGHNIALTYQGLDEAGDAVVRVDAGPGLGRGRWPCDEETYNVKDGPPGMVPLHGDVIIEGDRCYNIVPVLVSGRKWKFQVQGRCQACCTCDDYAQHAGWLKELSQRLNAVKQELDDSLATYEDGVEEFNTVIFPQIGSVTLDICGMRGQPYAGGKRGSPNMARIVFTLKNGRNNAILFKTWTVAFARPAGATVKVEDVTYEYGGSSDKILAGGTLNRDIGAGASAAVTLLVSCPLAQWISDPVWACTVTATFQDYVTNAEQTLTKTLNAL